MSDGLLEWGGLGELVVHMNGIEVAAQAGEIHDVRLGNRPPKRFPLLADVHIVKIQMVRRERHGLLLIGCRALAEFTEKGYTPASGSSVRMALPQLASCLVQSRVTTDLVCAMVCASEGNGQQRRGRPGKFDLRVGLRLVCAWFAPATQGAAQTKSRLTIPNIVTGLEAIRSH